MVQVTNGHSTPGGTRGSGAHSPITASVQREAADAGQRAAAPEGSSRVPKRPEPTRKRPTSTVERHAARILEGEEVFTIYEAAEMAGLSFDSAVRFWNSMGFPTIAHPKTSKIFRNADIDAMKAHAAALTNGLFTEDSLESLNRAQSHMSDRLVLWQHEVLVDYARKNFGLDGISARFWVLDHIDEYEEYLRSQTEYAWGRHMVALLRRSEAEASEMEVSQDSGVLLQRAFGFIDMVAFTNRTNELGAADFIKLIEEFDTTCRKVINAKGARIVKTIGDAFLYICDDLVTGAEVAVGIIDALKKVDGMLPVRASLVWGSVVSRFGDIFGPKVNLASRLVDAAESGTVIIDQETADILRHLKLRRYTLAPAGTFQLQGFGTTEAVELRRVPSGSSVTG